MASPFALLMFFSTYKLVGLGFFSLFFSSMAILLSTLLYIWKYKLVPTAENFATTPMLMNESMIEAMERKEEQQASDIGVVDNYDSDSDLDGSISDEENLIEIALPSGHFVDQQKQECKYNKCSLQQQKNLMELLAEYNEMYEEENLIEIDLSIGTIKCSRFENET